MTTARLEFVSTNKFVSVQDAGRRGAMRYGVSESGPMDWARHRLARVLAGETPGGPAIEVGLQGLAVRAAGDGPVRLALTGPGFRGTVGERVSDAPALFVLTPGETLNVASGGRGLWGYLAVSGADWGEGLLGSHATNARTGLGARDFSTPLPCRAASPLEAPALYADPVANAARDGAIALLPGPQHHLFAPDVQRTLVETPYRLTSELDRMGYKLEGEALVATDGHDIVSDGIVEGAMQVPGNGQPIVLMADRAPTGGYPKIAVVSAVDRPLMSQSHPGAQIRFTWTSAKEARARRRDLVAAIDAPQPRRRTEFSSQFLSERNLVGGVWSPGER